MHEFAILNCLFVQFINRCDPWNIFFTLTENWTVFEKSCLNNYCSYGYDNEKKQINHLYLFLVNLKSFNGPISLKKQENVASCLYFFLLLSNL